MLKRDRIKHDKIQSSLDEIKEKARLREEANLIIVSIGNPHLRGIVYSRMNYEESFKLHHVEQYLKLISQYVSDLDSLASLTKVEELIVEYILEVDRAKYLPEFYRNINARLDYIDGLYEVLEVKLVCARLE